jgi:hypothetical protein
MLHPIVSAAFLNDIYFFPIQVTTVEYIGIGDPLISRLFWSLEFISPRFTLPNRILYIIIKSTLYLTISRMRRPNLCNMKRYDDYDLWVEKGTVTSHVKVRPSICLDDQAKS